MKTFSQRFGCKIRKKRSYICGVPGTCSHLSSLYENDLWIRRIVFVCGAFIWLITVIFMFFTVKLGLVNKLVGWHFYVYMRFHNIHAWNIKPHTLCQ